MKLDLAQLQDYSRRAGWPENQITKAGAVWSYESSGNTNARNSKGENSIGLAQINLDWHNKEFDAARLTEPLYNLQCALTVYKREGWNAWKTSVGKYERDYQGIRSQSEKIYAAGGSNIIDTADVKKILDGTPLAKPAENSATNIMIASAVGLLLIGVTVIARR
jgi:hypothetical protein